MDPQTIAPWIAAAVAGTAAGFERWRGTRKEKEVKVDQALVSDAKLWRERAEVFEKVANDNLKAFKDEHEDHVKTRIFWHDKASEFQATLSACQEKLVDFQARPDFREMMEFLRLQSAHSLAIFEEIKQIRVEMSQNNKK